jgi:hypothetical protein
MDADRSEVGDERNTPFELQEFRRDVTPGCYYEEEPSSVAEGEYRIPRRRRQED